MVVTGHFLALERPRRISFTWSCSTWSAPDIETIVTVTLEPDDAAKTLMTIQHTLLPPDLAADHERGWTAIAQELDQKLRQPA